MCVSRRGQAVKALRVTHPPAVTVARRENGELLLTCPYAVGPLPRSVAHLLIERAQHHPDRSLIAQLSDEGEWQHLTYSEAVEGSRRVAQWLINRGASKETPLANGNHATILREF
ncbi:MAG: AMP-binding protein [Pseudomonadales bacterium]|nr:AMP-binding protein [Pseudomonadales bacterium]